MSLRTRPLMMATLTLVGCSSGTSATPLSPLTSASRTEDVTLVPVHTQSYDERNSADPAMREAMLEEGLGDEVQGPGEPYLLRPEDGTPPEPGAAPRMLLRFAHLADMQLADDESPSRVATLDGPSILGASYRPQDVYMCHLIRAMVRTLNAVNVTTPLSFVMLGGDNIDNAQENELEWMLSLLSGGELECDSGDDNDLVSGPDNDPKDPLISPGLDMPWYWVTGNHDVLAQGNFPVTEGTNATAIGTKTYGTRDWRLPGGPVVGSFFQAAEVPADPRRNLLTGAELLARVRDDGDGHGIPESQVESGQANYVLDVEGTPLRFLVVDTAYEKYGADGAIFRADLEGTILPLLEESAAMQKAVIVVSHHAPESFKSVDEDEPELVTPEEWTELLTSHAAVLFTLVAHSHENRIDRLDGERSIWMILTAALADFPHQSRILEIWDEDNGYFRIHTSTLDFSVEGDPLAAEGRRLGVLDYVSGWLVEDGRGNPDDRNVDLYIPKLY